MINRFIFPVTFSLNMFSVTALLVVLGMFGKQEMAAEVGIVQAAMLMLFMAFASNSRNIILGEVSDITVSQLVRFRLLLIIPLLLLAYYISSKAIDVPYELVLCLAIRRGLEWIAELQISERELEKDTVFAHVFSGVQLACLLVLLAVVIFDANEWFYFSLLLWAVSPGVRLWDFINKVYVSEKKEQLQWKAFLPHIGSSWIMAVTNYCFRAIIVLYAGKMIGGMLFSAYAIGGLVNSFYTHALGPSLAAQSDKYNSDKERLVIKYVVGALFVAGAIIALFAMSVTLKNTIGSNYYLLTIGLSLAGAGIMLLAQRKRIHVLQVDKNSVLIPDVISNSLIIIILFSTVFALSIEWLPAMFLWNSILSFVVYYQFDVRLTRRCT